MSNLSYDLELFCEMTEHKDRTHLTDGKSKYIYVSLLQLVSIVEKTLVEISSFLL